MTNALKITTIGNSVGIILPKDILAKLRVSKGDQVHVIETQNGIEITPFDPVLSKQMEAAHKVMRKHRDVLKQLADS
jgi:putative addiction module antidote